MNTYPEPYRSRPKDALVDPSTCYSRECVSYCAWKIAEATGRWPRRTGDMNAKNWIYRLPENGYPKVAAPREGGVYIGVSINGRYGHVVCYEGGNTISEYNWNLVGEYGRRQVNLSQFHWYEIKAPAASSAPAPAPAVPNRAPAEAVEDVINGRYGNGQDRANALRNAGFDPIAVQRLVNERLSAPAPAPAPAPTPKEGELKVGSRVVPVNGYKAYGNQYYTDYNGIAVQVWREKIYKIIELNGDRAVLAPEEAPEIIWCAMNTSNIRLA